MPKKFDAKWYLEKNPDVAASGMDPFLHYEKFGAAEGRRPSPATLFERYLIRAKVVFSVAYSVVRRERSFTSAIALCLRVVAEKGLTGLKIRIANHHYAMRDNGRQKPSYKKFIESFEARDLSERAEMLSHFDSCIAKPKISIVMATYNTPEPFLRNAIESVLKQSYENWELCIADDFSDKRGLRDILNGYGAADTRIKIEFRSTNGNISEATNSAIKMATGEFVAFLDHDDELHPDAILYVAKKIKEHPDVGLIYTDEDKINERGERSDPYFKCGFNYELMLTQNMVCHLAVYRKTILDDMGGLRKEFDGAQDYDVSLRIIETLRPEQIAHIPRVLYHWRMHSASTALNIDVKPNAVAASRRAVQDHLKRIKVDAIVKPHPDIPFWNKILFSLPQELPSVEIIIPTRDKIELLKTCIDSILERTTYSNYHITIIDNGSTEPISHKQFNEWMKHARISIMRDDSPFNFSRLNNRAVYSCRSQYVCLLNNDIEIITPEWLDEMVSVALRSCVGCVGARLWYPDGKLQHGGVVLGIGGVAGHAHKYLRRGEVGYFGRAVSLQAFSCVTGAALLVKKSIYEEVGGLDEGLPVAFNDVDFCLRVMQAGYRNVWTPYAEMYHYESASRGHEDDSEKIKRFHNEIHFMSNRWRDTLLNDPYYSPNLTRVHEDFSYANMSE